MYKIISVLVILFLGISQGKATSPDEKYDYSLKPGTGKFQRLIVTFQNGAEPLRADLSPKARLYKIREHLYTCEQYSIKGQKQIYWDIRVLDPVYKKFNPITFGCGNNIIDLGITNQTFYMLTFNGIALKIKDNQAIPIENPTEKAVAEWLLKPHSHL